MDVRVFRFLCVVYVAAFAVKSYRLRVCVSNV